MSYDIVSNTHIQIVKQNYLYTIWIGNVVYKKDLKLSQVNSHLKEAMEELTEEIKKNAN